MARALSARRLRRLSCLILSFASLSLWANAARAADCCIAVGATDRQEYGSAGARRSLPRRNNPSVQVTPSGSGIPNQVPIHHPRFGHRD